MYKENELTDLIEMEWMYGIGSNRGSLAMDLKVKLS